MKRTIVLSIVFILAFFQYVGLNRPSDSKAEEEYFKVYPIGEVMKEHGKTTIVLDKKYEPGRLRFEKLSHVTVVGWFHLNGNPSNPFPGLAQPRCHHPLQDNFR